MITDKVRTIKDAIEETEHYLGFREKRGDLQIFMQILENQLMIMRNLDCSAPSGNEDE